MRKQAAGFSLIELMAVVVIVGVLAALTMPASLDVLRGNKLERAGEQLSQAIARARMRASADNDRVFLLFLPIRETEMGQDGYGSYLLARPLPDEEWKALEAVEELPEGCLLAEDADLTGLDELGELTIQSKWGKVPANTAVKYLIFRPDGSTTLPPSSEDDNNAWYLTLVEERFATSTELPPNYAIVQFDPISGATSIHRP